MTADQILAPELAAHLEAAPAVKPGDLVINRIQLPGGGTHDEPGRVVSICPERGILLAPIGRGGRWYARAEWVLPAV